MSNDKSLKQELSFSADELNRISAYFLLLIEMDKKQKIVRKLVSIKHGESDSKISKKLDN
jgi:hypothetical protein